MIKHRPLAVKLVAAYLCLKAIILCLCVAAVYLRPANRPSANRVIEDLVPIIMGLREPKADIWLALLFVFTDLVLGLGVWFLQNWARIVIVIDLTWLFGRAAAGLLVLPLIPRSMLHLHAPSPYFAVNLAAGLLTLGCLLDPDIKGAFGARPSSG